MKCSKKFITSFMLVLSLLLLIFCDNGFVAATGKSKKLDGISFEMNDASGFVISDNNKSKQLCYGKRVLGELYLQGSIDEKTSFDDCTIYSTTSELSISYHYDGKTLQSDNKDEWNLIESDSKSLNGIDLKKKMKKGAAVIQCSIDGKDWDNVCIETDVFGKNRTILNDLYRIDEYDIRFGLYYRVLVGYRVGKRTKAQKKLKFIPDDTYEYKEIVEQYDFYVTYSQNAVVLRDISSGKDISDKKETENGFIIDKGGTFFDVVVTRNNELPYEADDLISVTQPGNYKIDITSETNKTYSYSIKVTKGLELTQLSPKVYDGGKKGKYDETNLVSDKTIYGKKSLTQIKIAQRHGSKIGRSKRGQFESLGITGETVGPVGLYLRLETPYDTDWHISSDEWGKKDKQTINGAYVGQIDTGALLIQKSSDGVNWVNVDAEAYADGLYTTDYYKYYFDKGDVLIYTPNGKELLKGLYLKVSYAYKIEDYSTGDESRFLEVYDLFLCSNELEAVTIHNLSVKKNLKEYIGDDKDINYEVYQLAETLESGSCTVTGFSIDTSLNPTVKYSVIRNNEEIALPHKNEYTQDGRYEIILKTAIGDEKKVIIYVDTQDATSAFQTYFEDGFITGDTGKRVYSEGKYPTYEGGKTKWKLPKMPENYLPLKGTIKNTTAGKETVIEMKGNEQEQVISDAGHYVVTLSTRPSSKSGDLSGDYRVFTFEFDIIKEGTAPGPKVNKDSLNRYAKSSISDSYPKYYGVTYPSAATGDITLAFSTWEAAKQYAYNTEKGNVEKQDDGTYRYKGSAKLSGRKEQIESTWDLTDAINYFAEQAVQELYFDLSEPFCSRTLDQSLIDKTKNLRTLELLNSVIIFADDEEKETLCSLDNALPIISPKPYLYQNPGLSGKEENGFTDFQFVHDKYGCDSESVIITDCNGKAYQIDYQTNVGDLLQKQGCPTGIVTITERNIYQEETSYQAVYIAENANTAAITLAYYQNGQQEEKTYSQADANAVIKADAFSIGAVKDDLDPYTLICVKKAYGNDLAEYYVSDQECSKAWSDEGTYEVKVINRLGYFYTITVEIENSDYASLSFIGTGTENAKAVITTYGAKNVTLPKLVRKGFELTGFEDESGNKYSDEISEIVFKGTKVLTAVWKAKQFDLILTDENGNTLKTDTLEFGRKYDLPAPNLPENLLFVGWAENGERLTDNTYTLSEEKDITLVALTEQKQVTTTETESNSEKEEKPKNSIKWLLGAGGLAVLVMIFKELKKKPLPPANPPVEQPGANTPKIGTPIHRLTNTTDNSSGNMNGSDPQPPTNNTTEGGK